MNPKDDGKTHINIYSKGRTPLGRMLSNFALYPIETEDGRFNTIEGYWYWLGCGEESLRDLTGYEAKKIGSQKRHPDWKKTAEFEQKILKAVRIKIETYPEIKKALLMSELPFTHYYEWEGTVKDATGSCRFLIDFIAVYRNELKMNAFLKRIFRKSLDKDAST